MSTQLRHVISEAEDIGSFNGNSNSRIVPDEHEVTGSSSGVGGSNSNSSIMGENRTTSHMDVVVAEVESTAVVAGRVDIVQRQQQQRQQQIVTEFLNDSNNNIHNIVMNTSTLINANINNNNNNILDENTYPTSRLLNNDIPPSIQSLQQQYYSSSSLSGDDDNDADDSDLDTGNDETNQNRDIHNDDDHHDEPLVQSGSALQQQQLYQQLPPPSMMNNNLQTIVAAHNVPQQPQRTTGGGGMTRMQSGSTSSTQSGSSSLQARSSQNSSRDWGWFDDAVHATTHTTGTEMMTMMMMNTPSSRSGMDSVIPPGTHHHHQSGGAGRGGNGAAGGGDRRSTRKNQHNRVSINDPMLVMNDHDHDENRTMMINAMAVTAPHYVLEESLSSQFLWKNSAGQRPPQPVEERAFYEKMWAQNFERSNVEYNMPVEILTATSPLSLDPFTDTSSTGVDYAHHTVGTVPLPTDNGDYHHHHLLPGTAGTDIAEAALVYRMNDDRNHHPYSDNSNHPSSFNSSALHNYYSAPMKREVKDASGDGGTLTVLVRGDNVFGTTVSKSFARTNTNGDVIAGGVDTINISIASYRVVESSKHGKYAQFLVIYRQGSIRDTIGIWKRYRDFEELAHRVTQAHEGCVAAFANISPLHTVGDHDHETEHLPNAITSWKLLKKRKRWYRCLDAGYLSLKVFLLERFLHDILFESSSPHLLRDFVLV